MRTLIRRRLPDGSRQEQVVDSISLTFGRGTDNAVELPGLAVAPRHAKLSCTTPGRYVIESTALTGLEVNGVAGVRERELVPGDKVRIGDHVFAVAEPGPNVDAVIELEFVQPKIATAREAPAPPMLTLHGTGMGYRRASWVIGTLVLIVALVLPMASTSLPDRWPGLLPSDRLWTSGRISGGHTYFGEQCGTCHQDLFERVADSACTSCHATTKHHSNDPAIRTMAGFAELRCASCHREHDAVAGLDPPHPDICTDCHATPRFADFPDLAPVTDFGTGHPAFRPLVTVKAGDGTVREERRDQAPDLKDQHGLIFNHKLHLEPAGVRAPDGPRVLACGDCHAPHASRQGFMDLSYATHCAGCHALDAQLGGQAVRLPHADESMLRELLGKYLARVPAAAPEPAPEEDARRRVGESAERGSAGDLGDEVRRTASRVCAKCHELQTAADGLPRARALALRHTWLTHARFTHAEHEAMPCTRCHAADTSASAEQLLLPALGDCRTCHAGVDSPRGVASTCIDCHRLHQARQPWTGEPKGERVSDRREPQQQ